MGKVVANMSMLPDGFIEDGSGSVAPVFAWLAAGDQVVAAPGDEREFQVSRTSAEYREQRSTAPARWCAAGGCST